MLNATLLSLKKSVLFFFYRVTRVIVFILFKRRKRKWTRSHTLTPRPNDASTAGVYWVVNSFTGTNLLCKTRPVRSELKNNLKRGVGYNATKVNYKAVVVYAYEKIESLLTLSKRRESTTPSRSLPFFSLFFFFFHVKENFHNNQTDTRRQRTSSLDDIIFTRSNRDTFNTAVA